MRPHFKPSLSMSCAPVVLSCLIGLGGCSGDSVETGSVVKDDLQAAKEREKLISDQYQKTPPVTSAPKK